MSPILDTRFVTIYDPTTRPASFVGLEVLVLGVAALTLWHAVRAHRRGDRAALLTWITIAVYGLVMEIVSYNLVDNFAHGQFTVMFYDHQLPLYVTAIYPALLYTGIATARRLGLPWAAEALAAGVLIVAMDVPFDVVGPAAGWWVWFDTDPNIAYRWFGVPVTSYYWHFAFGGILAAITAAVARRSTRARGPSPALALPVSVVTIVLGVLAFLPFHGLKALGVSDGLIVGVAISGAAAAAIAARRIPVTADRSLAALWLPFYGFHLVVAASLAVSRDGGWTGRLVFIAAVAAVAAAVALVGRVRAGSLGPRPA